MLGFYTSLSFKRLDFHCSLLYPQMATPTGVYMRIPILQVGDLRIFFGVINVKEAIKIFPTVDETAMRSAFWLNSTRHLAHCSFSITHFTQHFTRYFSSFISMDVVLVEDLSAVRNEQFSSFYNAVWKSTTFPHYCHTFL